MEPLEIIDRYGLPVTALIGLWLLARQVIDRLLNKQDGILTGIANRHIQFVDQLQKAQTQIGDAADVAKEQMMILNASRGRLISAATYACDVLEETSKALNIEEETKGPLEAMRRELLSYTH